MMGYIGVFDESVRRCDVGIAFMGCFWRLWISFSNYTSWKHWLETLALSRYQWDDSILRNWIREERNNNMRLLQC